MKNFKYISEKKFLNIMRFCFMLALLWGMTSGSLGAQQQSDSPSLDKLSSTFNEVMDSASPSIFRGVGRQLPKWGVGLDLLVISTPHYQAKRKLGLNNYSLWGQWWGSDLWGVKSFFSEQSYHLFGNTSDSAEAVSRNLGILFKIRHALNLDWRVSAGMGIAKTGLSPQGSAKSCTSLVSEIKASLELNPDFSLDLGILTIDGTTGTGAQDQRLGSTSHMIGLGFVF